MTYKVREVALVPGDWCKTRANVVYNGTLMFRSSQGAKTGREFLGCEFKFGVVIANPDHSLASATFNPMIFVLDSATRRIGWVYDSGIDLYVSP